MTPLEPVVLSFGAALLLGLVYGAGPCNLACLPYLGPVFTATEGGVRSAWRTLLPFSLGRLSGYALLGGLAGGLGLLVQDWLAAPWVRWLLGGATILVGISILFRRRSLCQGAGARSHSVPLSEISVLERPRLLPGGLFVMGLGMAMNPCAPLTTVVLASATSASIITGISLGTGFALGAVFVPTWVFALGVAHFGGQLRHHLTQHRFALENTSVLLLVLTGTATAMGWMTP
ncbi:MAG: sulfite exporter TauE/SafE family protein [Candidatus Thiodiazotropha sp.]